jgi:molybdopterin converting factor small subunit
VSVAFRLPGPLQPFAQGAREVVLAGAPTTVGEALDLLAQRFPGVEARVRDEEGRLRPHVNVFVGRDSVRDAAGLRTPLPPDARVWIIPAVSGG